MIFLFPRWDMLIPWRVLTAAIPFVSKKKGVVGHLRPALRGAARRKLLGEEARRSDEQIMIGKNFDWKPKVELENSWGRESLIYVVIYV